MEERVPCVLLYFITTLILNISWQELIIDPCLVINIIKTYQKHLVKHCAYVDR